jgi:hypothetical protein
MPLEILINGEPIRLADSARERADVEGSFELRAVQSVELRLTEADQKDPAGRYRLLVTSDELLVQRSIEEAGWEKPVTMFKVVSEDSDAATGSHGVGLVAFNEDALDDLLQKLILQVSSGGPVGLRVRELVQLAMLA